MLYQEAVPLAIASQASRNTVPDFEEWRKLAREVCAFKPDYVVLLARKMTRLWQRMREIDRRTFLPDVPTVSHFALDYLAPENIRGKNVAVIDDAINIGSTMRHVCGKLQAIGVASVRCYVLSCKESFNRENLGRFKNNLYIRKENSLLKDQEYHANAATLNRCLLFAGRPLELEFPIYTLDLGDTSQEQFQDRLKTLEVRWQWVTYVDADVAGMGRASVLRENAQGDVVKHRFYFDRHRDRVLYMPMPFSQGKSTGRRFTGRAELYAHGKQLMAEYWPTLKEYGVHDIHLVEEDTRLLFGSDFDVKLLQRDKDGEEGAESVSEDYMLCALLKSRSFTDALEKHTFSSSVRLTFIKIFEELGRAVGEVAPGSMDTTFEQALPSFLRETIRYDNFMRLRLGLTVPEIIDLLRRYCPTPANDAKLESMVSGLLDEHIDQGFVVPMLDLAHRRAFRKGEAAPQDRALLYALGCRSANFGENLEEKLQALVPSQRGKVIHLLEVLENGVS